MITYNESKKDLPVDHLYRLFYLAGWAGSESSADQDMLKKFNAPFINSTLVISAWDDDRLVGAARVLSDKVIRSGIYDLVVDPEYRNMGIGKELVRGCIAHKGVFLCYLKLKELFYEK
jgi:ribosomal protein S18 acetylase RimI-like enzyme